MRFHHKLILLIVGLVALLLTPYVLRHEQVDAYFASEAYRRWLLSARPYAWVVAMALIVGDLVRPISTCPQGREGPPGQVIRPWSGTRFAGRAGIGSPRLLAVSHFLEETTDETRISP